MTESVSELEQRAETVNDCCEVDLRNLGREDHLVRLGSRVVLLHDWVAKPGAPGEYTGFSMTVSNGASISFLVKAETQMYSGGATSWSVPDGTRSIDRVNFCGECDSPDGCEDGGEDDGGGGGDGGGGYDDGDGGGGGGDGGGDDDGCDNLDGCPDGGSGHGPLL